MDPSERPTQVSGIVRGGTSSVKALSFDDLAGSAFDLITLPTSRGGDPKQAKINDLETRLATAQAELKSRKEEYERQLVVGRDEAYQKGLKDGTTAGETSGRAIAQAQAERKLGEVEASIRSRLEAIERSLEQVYLDWESRLMELAMAISRRIVGKACEIPGEASMHVARMALRKLGSEARVILRCHPQDLTSLEVEKELWGGRGGARKVVIEPDESVGRGGIVIETDTGTIDARIPRLTENVERALAQALEEERPRGHLPA